MGKLVAPASGSIRAIRLTRLRVELVHSAPSLGRGDLPIGGGVVKCVTFELCGAPQERPRRGWLTHFVSNRSGSFRMSEQSWCLKQCDLFRRLTEQDLRDMEAASRMRRFEKGEPIYLPADQADGVLLLATGRVRICSITEEGKQSILTFVEPGELFGEMSLVGVREREDFAESSEKSTVVLIPGPFMQNLIDRRGNVALGITKLFGLRRRRIERRLKYLLFRSNRQRLVHLLLELAEDYGEQTSEGVRLGIKLSHQDLASIIGSTRETVTVLLGELQAEGWLRLGRRKIVLTDLSRLANSVHESPPQIDTPAPLVTQRVRTQSEHV